MYSVCYASYWAQRSFQKYVTKKDKRIDKTTHEYKTTDNADCIQWENMLLTTL